MIDLYLWPTANGFKPLIAVEELRLVYTTFPVDITKGEQFDPSFLEVAPNNRIPAIRDNNPADGGEPIAVFESGAILAYLAEKAGALLPQTLAHRYDVLQWLNWQMSGLGPNMGQAGHFIIYAQEDVPYAKTRFLNETRRLLGVMERRLADREYLAGDYSIADIACYPWVIQHTRIDFSIDAFPRVQAWAASIGSRPAVIRAYEVGNALPRHQELDDAARKVLFGQGDT